MVKKENTKLLQKRSSVWIHFHQIGVDRAKCGVCHKILSISGGSTSNLKRHFKIKHKKKIAGSSNNSMNSSQHEKLNYTLLNEGEVTEFENGEGDHNVTIDEEEEERKYKVVPKRSPIWIYFNQLTRAEVKCSLCGSIISTRGGGTSNLRRHLRSKHAKVIGGKQLSLEEDYMSEKSIVQDEDGNEYYVNILQNDNDGEEDNLPEVTSGQPIHSEVVVDSYLEMGTALNDSEEQNTSTIDSSPHCSNPIKQTKPNILKRTAVPAKITILKKRKPNEPPPLMRVADSFKGMNNSSFLLNRTKKDTESLNNIATNLGRIATAFERMADHFCATTPSSSSINHQRKQQPVERQDHSVDLQQISNDGLGAKVNEMIIKVLGDEVVTNSASDVEFETQSVNDKAATLLKCLNLLPRMEAGGK